MTRTRRYLMILALTALATVTGACGVSPYVGVNLPGPFSVGVGAGGVSVGAGFDVGPVNVGMGFPL
ncbi:MAG: hypothetical protein LJF30_00705 [Acidobacteria bacterium]|jgi:hypothetical protein|nr:hypothetical protein [Acidobacteriota bacterium]